jgi:hypothetical protein
VNHSPVIAPSSTIGAVRPDKRSAAVKVVGSNINPEGCWNWWGYAYDKRYLFKDGIQVSAIWAMVQRVSGQAD